MIKVLWDSVVLKEISLISLSDVLGLPFLLFVWTHFLYLVLPVGSSFFVGSILQRVYLCSQLPPYLVYDQWQGEGKMD